MKSFLAIFFIVTLVALATATQAVDNVDAKPVTPAKTMNINRYLIKAVV